jgi:hypothetical protein
LGVIIGAPSYPLNRHNESTFSGRAPSQLKNHKDRDARPVRCNGWLSPLTCGREYILPSVENRRLKTKCSFSDQMPQFFISFAKFDQLGV